MSFLSKKFSMAGKSVLVVGASSGLGAHFARTLARAGASSIVLAARRVAKLETVADSIQAFTGNDGSEPNSCNVACVPIDVAKLESIRSGIDRAENLAGSTIDVCINCAGIAAPAPALEMDEYQWDSLMNINLRGNFFVAREIAKRLVEHKRPGSIVNVASILGLRPGSNNANYGASKAGLLHATRILANELLRHNIRVNSLCPGYFKTELNADFFDSDAGTRYLSRIPPRRLGRLEELDGALLLLASDAGSFMTGTEIVVDLGHSNANL